MFFHTSLGNKEFNVILTVKTYMLLLIIIWAVRKMFCLKGQWKFYGFFPKHSKSNLNQSRDKSGSDPEADLKFLRKKTFNILCKTVVNKDFIICFLY